MADENHGRSWWQRLRRFFTGQQSDVEADPPPELPLVVPEVTIARGRDDVPQASLRVPEMADGVDVVALRQQMMNHLDLAELGRVAMAIDFELEAVPGGKGRKVMGVVAECGANGRLPDLLHACRTQRPDVTWQPDWAAPEES